MTPQIPEDMTELVDADVPRVDLVNKAANGTKFFMMKTAAEPMLNAEDVRDVLAKAEEDEELGDAPESVDLTETLAEPAVGASGEASTPGSPAWEAIDAATACKWIAVLGRVMNGVTELAGREAMEATAGESDDDYENQWNLQDACGALDYAMGLLAPYAVSEAQDSQYGTEAATAVGKACELFAPLLSVTEGLTTITKAGRALSASNESALRNAAEAIQKVLASLPPAPDEAPLAKEATLTEKEAPAPVTKAEGDAAGLMAVFNSKGDLIGVTDPANIQAVAGATASADAPAADAAPDAPAAADDAPSEAAVPGTDTVQSPVVAEDDPNNVKKGTADIAAALEEALAPIVKQLGSNAELTEAVRVLKERVESFGREPDDRKSPLLNGGTGTAGIAKRDGTEIDPTVDLRKAVDEAKNQDQRIVAQKALSMEMLKRQMDPNTRYQAVLNRFVA